MNYNETIACINSLYFSFDSYYLHLWYLEDFKGVYLLIYKFGIVKSILLIPNL